MKTEVSAQFLLVVATVLLAANLVITFTLHSAAPAQAAQRTCTGIAVVNKPDQYPSIYRCWSDGTVEYATSP